MRFREPGVGKFLKARFTRAIQRPSAPRKARTRPLDSFWGIGVQSQRGSFRIGAERIQSNDQGLASQSGKILFHRITDSERTNERRARLQRCQATRAHVGVRPALGRAFGGRIAAPTSFVSAAPSTSSTRSRESAHEKLWKHLADEPYVAALGTLTGGQATQAVKAGPQGHLSFRLASRRRRQPLRADLSRSEPLSRELRTRAREAPQQRVPACGPDPADAKVKRTSIITRRSSPMRKRDSAARSTVHEIMKAFIEAGAAGVHFEDQLASEKKCGHMGGKVLIPTKTADSQSHLRAARGRSCSACRR